MARARVYRHDLRCPHCGSTLRQAQEDPQGRPFPGQEQTYRCRDCHFRFTPHGNRHYFPEATKRRAVDLYAEGTGINAASRALGVKPVTVLSWVKKARQSWELMGRMTRLPRRGNRECRQPG